MQAGPCQGHQSVLLLSGLCRQGVLGAFCAEEEAGPSALPGNCQMFESGVRPRMKVVGRSESKSRSFALPFPTLRLWRITWPEELGT